MKYAQSSIMHKIAAVYFLWICRKTSQKSWHATNDYICQSSKLEIYASSSLSSPSLPKQRGELTFPFRTTFLVLIICQCGYGAHKQPEVCKWHIQKSSQRIVLCHGMISKTWGNHQWATGGGFSMGGTEGCTRSTTEICINLRLPLIIWKSSKLWEERSFEHERYCH